MHRVRCRSVQWYRRRELALSVSRAVDITELAAGTKLGTDHAGRWNDGVEAPKMMKVCKRKSVCRPNVQESPASLAAIRRLLPS